MKNILAVTALLCFAIFAAACGSPAANTTNTANAKPGDKPASTAPATTTTAPKADDKKAEVASTGDSIGVPECDEYIKKYEACLTKIAAKAPAVEGPMKQAFETARKGWKDAAANPAGKATLASACKTAMDTAKSTTTAYACEW